MIGYIVIDTAVPLKNPVPAEAIQAAPILASDASLVGWSLFPFIMSIILYATCLAITPEGIPVLGGVGKIGVPFGLEAGFDIG